VDPCWKYHFEEISKDLLGDNAIASLGVGDSISYMEGYIYQKNRIQRGLIRSKLVNRVPNALGPKYIDIDSPMFKNGQYRVGKDTLRCVCVGDNCIGKTSALYALFKNNFPQETTKLGRDDGVYETLIEFSKIV
jgi:hypothetical protein